MFFVVFYWFFVAVFVGFRLLALVGFWFGFFVIMTSILLVIICVECLCVYCVW